MLKVRESVLVSFRYHLSDGGLLGLCGAETLSCDFPLAQWGQLHGDEKIRYCFCAECHIMSGIELPLINVLKPKADLVTAQAIPEIHMIAVTSWLPKTSDPVLVLLKPRRTNQKKKVHCVGAYFRKTKTENAEGWHEPLSDMEIEVTHWYPLPK